MQWDVRGVREANIPDDPTTLDPVRDSPPEVLGRHPHR